MQKPDARSPRPWGQIASLQILRFVAALGVALAHLQGALVRSQGATLAGNFAIGAAGVDLFFVISGFVIVYSSERMFGHGDAPLNFFLRRGARIVPLYALFTLAIILYLLWTYGTLEAADHSWASAAASLAFVPYFNLQGNTVPIYGVGWTLNYEMFFYLLFACLVWLPRTRATLSAVTALVAIVIAGQFQIIPGPYSVLGSPIVLEFAYGAAIALLYRGGLRLSPAVAIVLALCALAALAASAWVGPGQFARALEWGVPAAALIASTTLAAWSLPPCSRVVRFGVLLGDASYALYLVHPLALGAARRLLSPLLEVSPLVYSVAAMASCVGAAMLIHVMLERPMTRALRQRLQRFTGGGQENARGGEAIPGCT